MNGQWIPARPNLHTPEIPMWFYQVEKGGPYRLPEGPDGCS